MQVTCLYMYYVHLNNIYGGGGVEQDIRPANRKKNQISDPKINQFSDIKVPPFPPPPPHVLYHMACIYFARIF